MVKSLTLADEPSLPIRSVAVVAGHPGRTQRSGGRSTWGQSTRKTPRPHRPQRTSSEAPSGSFHGNSDLAPTTFDQRRWGCKDIAALWVSMSACIPTYMLASSLIAEGMNWWQAILTIFLGNTIVLVPMVLNAHAGTKYGIPFPIYCRASFGILGANVPAMLRALVACGWFGIQTWIGGEAIYKILAIYVPAWPTLPQIAWLGINAAQVGLLPGVLGREHRRSFTWGSNRSASC